MPIVPFQLPAASDGNGDLSYTTAGLPAGLNFDATGADAGGCTAADFPTGFIDTAGLATRRASSAARPPATGRASWS